MAVAGFADEDLDISYEQNTLTVKGERKAEEGDDFLYRGIATRSFQRKFNLADHVKVTGAQLEHGLLHIFLERELPEAMKPKTIKINTNVALLDSRAEEKAA